ncbi:MAG: hypothetical protein ABI577_11705 [bacterium]
MRLKPALSAEEAFQFLSASAVLTWGAAAASEITTNLRSIAEAMAVVGALDIPDETEPLFGEDPARMWEAT